MNRGQILTALRSLELYLSAHPDNEEHSECADRIADVKQIQKEIQFLLAENEQLKELLKGGDK